MGGGKDYEQEKSTRKRQIPSAIEGMYGRRRYLEGQGKSKELL